MARGTDVHSPALCGRTWDRSGQSELATVEEAIRLAEEQRRALSLIAQAEELGWENRTAGRGRAYDEAIEQRVSVDASLRQYRNARQTLLGEMSLAETDARSSLVDHVMMLLRTTQLGGLIEVQRAAEGLKIAFAQQEINLTNERAKVGKYWMKNWPTSE